MIRRGALWGTSENVYEFARTNIFRTASHSWLVLFQNKRKRANSLAAKKNPTDFLTWFMEFVSPRRVTDSRPRPAKIFSLRRSQLSYGTRNPKMVEPIGRPPETIETDKHAIRKLLRWENPAFPRGGTGESARVADFPAAGLETMADFVSFDERNRPRKVLYCQ